MKCTIKAMLCLCLLMAVSVGAKAPADASIKRVMIVTGQDYPGHKWPETTPVLKAGLAQDARLQVDVVEQPSFLATERLWDYDALVLHFMNWEQPDPGPQARANLLRYVEQGGGLVLVHFACGAFQGWPAFADVAGRVWDPNLRGHDPHGEFQVRIVDANHPVTAGLDSFQTVDELYTCLAGSRPVQILASAQSKVDQKEYAMAFSFDYGRGRVFHSPLGHDVRAFNQPVQALFRRGCAWAAGLQP